MNTITHYPGKNGEAIPAPIETQLSNALYRESLLIKEVEALQWKVAAINSILDEKIKEITSYRDSAIANNNKIFKTYDYGRNVVINLQSQIDKI